MTNKQIIIGLAGEPSSGKDTVAKYLQEKYGAKVIRFADPLTDALKNFVDNIGRDDYQWLSHAVRERFGQDIFSLALKKRITEKDELVVLNGVRFWVDYDFIRSFENNFFLYITADQKARWERAMKRMEKTDDNVSFEKFQELEKFETEAIIPEIGKKADYTIRNEKDAEYLLKEVDAVMEKIIKK